MSPTGTPRSFDSRNRTSSSRPAISLRSTSTTVDARFPTSSLPLRSRMRPRSGSMGTVRTWFCEAWMLNWSVASTCRNHSLVVRAANMNTTSPARTFSLIRVLDSVMGSPSPSEHLAGPGRLGHPPDQREQKGRQHRVVQTGQERDPYPVAELHVQLPEQEAHHPREQDAGHGGAPNQADRQHRAGAGDVLPEHPHRVADQRARQG